MQLTARVQVLENIIGDIQGYIEKVAENLILNHVKEVKDHLTFFKAWLVFTEDV